MRRYRRAAALVGAAAAIAGSVAGASAAAAGTTGSAVGSTVNSVLSRTTEILQTCSTPSAHHAACLSQEHVLLNHFASGLVRPAAGTSTTSGYIPSDLHAAYALPALTATNGTGQTVGIVDAFNDPTAAADLATYRTAYGLPACTVASGCFRQVGQTGTSTLPSTDTGWAQEESLDLDMVSAICPNCKIILVEATSASDADLATSVNTAVSLGATEVSNSYGGSETSAETSGLDKTAYSHPGVAITASAGDSGYGVEFPAASPTVTAVGGTSLTKTTSGRGWSETVWGSSSGGGLFGLGGTAEGTGSGCSAYVAKPSWQHDTGCTKRTVADVSAVADPNTGVAVYDSTSNSGQVGWQQFGGTSVSSPIIASVYALAGGVSSSVNGASLPYANTSHLNDVTSGANGSCTGGFLGFGGSTAKKYLCTAQAGYDGPTGLGTPNGLLAF